MFSSVSARIWNNQSPIVISVPTVNIFKLWPKTCLISEYVFASRYYDLVHYILHVIICFLVIFINVNNFSEFLWSKKLFKY